MNRRYRGAQPLYLNQKALVLALAAALVAAFSLYVYFITASVVQVVLRREVEQQLTDVTAEISELETKYVAAQNAISADAAAKRGYVAVSKKIYVDRTSTAVALSKRP
jgi:hypothetical protein